MEEKKDLYNWSETYKDFPRIPPSKRWMQNVPNTLEQLIVDKLFRGIALSSKEEIELKEALQFYESLIPKLQAFDLTSLLNAETLLFFKNYFCYAFNNIPHAKTGVYANHLVRIVKNESVLKKREKIREEKSITYPPPEIVKNNNKYNRCNTPEFTLFYGSNCIDAVLNELKPKEKELVTVGIWKKREPATPLMVYPITHNPLAIEVNEEAKNGYDKFQQIAQMADPLMTNFMQVLFDFISNEFAKPVNNHMQYLISALFSEHILQMNAWKHHGIAYPSVENKFKVHNLAILPTIIDTQYKLSKVIEFEVSKIYYERQSLCQEIEEITLVEYENLESTTWIEDDGSIIW